MWGGRGGQERKEQDWDKEDEVMKDRGTVRLQLGKEERRIRRMKTEEDGKREGWEDRKRRVRMAKRKRGEDGI